MTLRIACSNQKGGTGKTTVAINLTGALAQRGHDVLLIDLDPQGHTTEALGFEDAFRADRRSLYHALTDAEADVLPDLVREHPECDVVPSHEDMAQAEPTLTTERRREERLRIALDGFDDDYDFTVVDCPPNLGLLTDNALLATRNLVVPAQTRSSAKRALEILFEQIDEIEAMYDVHIRLLGVIANEYRRDNEAEAMLAWYREQFGDEAVYVIPTRVALQRAWNAGLSIFEHEESAPDAAGEFGRLAADLEAVAAADDAEVPVGADRRQ